jgi:hypothetical protein
MVRLVIAKATRQTMFFIQLSGEFSRSFAYAPGVGKLNLRPVNCLMKFTRSLANINARVHQKANALPFFGNSIGRSANIGYPENG